MGISEENFTSKLTAEQKPAAITAATKRHALRRIYLIIGLIYLVGIINLISFIVIFFHSNIIYDKAFNYLAIIDIICTLISFPLWIYTLNYRKTYHIKTTLPIVLSTIGFLLSSWQIILAIAFGFRSKFM